MKIIEVLDQKIAGDIQKIKVIGIDIGSRTAKAVLFHDDELYTAAILTGIDMQETANELVADLLTQSGLNKTDINYIVGTGYGRVAMKFDNPYQIVSEISCHAMGIHYLAAGVKTIIDIGGQDSKAIKVDPETGRVVEFVMNDKCAAGTGRFLEKVAQLLDYNLDELGTEALKAQKLSDVSSQCVVFAESEVISRRAKGELREDIAAGIHYAAARRVRSLLSQVGLEPGLAFSGGVSNNAGMKKAIEEVIGSPVSPIKLDAIYAGALGAAIYAHNYYLGGMQTGEAERENRRLDLTALESRIAQHHEAIIHGAGGQKKVGYLCTYTPLELINAAGIAHARLFKMGNTEVVASGEQITQSVFCDFTKSILGAFKENDALYKSLDKVYIFYTCDCIKKVGEAIGEFFAPSDIYTLPRLRHKDSSRDYYRTVILHFQKSLEELSGNIITEEAVREQIKLYNKVRVLLKKISELRKRENPPITGKDFLELIKGYHYLPPQGLLELYGRIYDNLAAVPNKGQRKIRLMMAGGIVADGDRRLLELIEDDIGARIVVEDHCTGVRNILHTINEEGDPYQALAEGYLDQSPCTRMKPLGESVDIAGELAKEYDVDGILYVYLKFCPCYGMIKHEFFKHYQKLGIPVLELPIDYSASDQGQLKTRLEAFIEVLGERAGSVRLKEAH
ncbi:MAG TPA: acyl-CoA dehydratase activase [Methylomusa anaerophila]|uniref:R-phenyllactate dehydratase activator n=1 Tax=Methylomusa anaerophila TaxID=1930071 RepID=A0A348AIL0_9FIRM|nr:2-hydroxyacyl-CoA dehydratase [Methylomusa anaerophila]BBB90908.1 R-phenyllactate dehydratase activator [Methylomusa anaerophila]HML90686.1 acyl-CoA dehydratase activase [Methylomusa anaerophila]